MSRSNSPIAVSVNWQVLEDRWDGFVLVALTALLSFMPLSFGAVEAWSELVVVLAALGLAVSLAVRKLVDDDFRLVPTATYIPLAVVLGLIVLQLVPLPAGLLATFAPQNVAVRQELLGDGSAAANLGSTSLSLYPLATAHDLRLALVFVALFLLTASVFRTSKQIEWVLGVVFVIGCTEAAISLLQILTLSDKLLWMFPLRGHLVTSGSFVNYSHFCQFVNLSMGAGVALLLVRMKEDKRADQLHSVEIKRVRWDRYLRLLVGLVMCAVAVLMSMSRNGALSLFVAAAAVGLLLYRRGELTARGWLLGMAPLCVLAVLFMTSFDLVYERLATLENNEPFDQRLEMTAGTLRAWRDYPLWGSGLGTHEFVFPRYDTAMNPLVAQHADNDWAQLLEEFGVVGFAAVLAFLIGIATVTARLILRGRTILATAAYGLCFGFVATAMHSLSDFGQHIPAVFSLTAVTSGLVVAIARYENRERKTRSKHLGSDRKRRGGGGQRWKGALALAGLGVVGWWAVDGAVAAYRSEAWANVALAMDDRLQNENWLGTDQDYVDLLTATDRAHDAQPRDVKLGYLLNYYRWRSISRVVDPDTGNPVLHPDVLPFVGQIADQLRAVRPLCPTYGPPYGLEGELRLFVLREPAGARLIRLAAELSPYDAFSCFAAGKLAADEGQIDEAAKYLDRTVALDPRQFAPVAELYLNELGRPDLAERLAGGDHRRLTQLADMVAAPHGENEQYAELADKWRNTALEHLRDRVEGGEAEAKEIARLADKELADENFTEAVELYRRALAQKYGQTSWRLSLARALAAQGEVGQAMREAKICLRLRPGMQTAARLIEELSVLPVPAMENSGE